MLVVIFIVTENAGSTHAGLTYLSRYPEQFTNVAIFPVDLPLVMYMFFLLLMGSTPTKNQGSMIWRWVSSGLLSVVGCGYVQNFLWELLLLIVGNFFIMGFRETAMTNWSVSENYRNELLKIYSTILLNPRLVPRKIEYLPLLRSRMGRQFLSAM